MPFDATQTAPVNLLGPDDQKPDPATLPAGYIFKPRGVARVDFVEYDDAGNLVYGSVPGPIPFSIPTNPTYYVSPSGSDGSDGSDGSVGAPFQTVDHALQLLSLGWYGLAQIKLRAGAHTLGNRTVLPAPIGNSNNTAGGLLIDGVDSTDSGLGTRTSSGGTTGSITTSAIFGTCVDSVGGLAVNAYRGQFLRFTSGAVLNGRSFLIVLNTATTFTIAGVLPAAPTTEAFVVETPAATLTWSGIESMQGSGAVGFQSIAFSGPGGGNALRLSRAIIGLQRCAFKTLGSGGIQLRNGAVLTDLNALTSYFGTLSVAQQCGSFFSAAPISVSLSSTSGMYPGGLNLNSSLFVDSNIESFSPIQMQFRSSYFTGNSYIRCAYKGQLLTSGNLHDAVTPAPFSPNVIVGGFGAAIVVSKGSNASINISDISNTPANGTGGHAISVEDGSMADVSSVTGSGNAGLGASITRHSSIRSNLADTVTGALGDVKIGSNAVTTWASITPETFQTDPVQLCLGSHHF